MDPSHRSNGVNELRVPKAVQVVARIVREPVDDDLHVVPASIVIIRGMKRLVNVTAQVKNKLQREETFVGINPERCWLRLKLLDLIDGASLS